MENESVNLIVENDKDETFLIKVPSSSIKSGDLREILRKQVSKKQNKHFYFIYKKKKYTKNDLDEIIHSSL